MMLLFERYDSSYMTSSDFQSPRVEGNLLDYKTKAGRGLVSLIILALEILN